jgi:hypothetical protein
MRRRLGLRPRVAGLITIAALAAVMTLAFAGSALADGTFNWNGVNGATACSPTTTGDMLWIFNPHSDAVPGDFTITWTSGSITYPASDWTNSGGSQNWHLTVPITGTFADLVSASLAYTGTVGDNYVLTISGCNEGGGGPEAAAPTISKTAAQSQDTEYTWTINKAVDKTEIDPTPGGTATFNYTVTVSHDGGTTTTSDVTGTISVFNNNDAAITLDSITDELSDGTVCTVDTTGDPTLTIPANGSQDFPYSCGLSALPSDYPDTTNTATMMWSHQVLTTSTGGTLDLPAGADFFTTPVVFTVTTSDDCASVSDTFAGDLGNHCVGGTGDVNGTFTFTYSKTFNAPALGTCASHTNTASFVDNSTPQNSGSADKTVQVCTFNAPLTIGYWATHMYQCPKGTKIGTNGCNNNGPFTDSLLGTSICGGACVAGKLSNTFTATASTALTVFNANNCSNASTSDSNAAACLAAQLLAAELNVANVANPCICTTITNAIAFLTAVGYNGPGSKVTFNATYTRAGAIALKTALDNYNNGKGCPA